MSSSTSSEQQRFVVFFLYNDKSVPQSFLIPKDAEVKYLRVAIRDDPDLKHHLENETLHLYRCGELDMEPLDALYQSTLKWLRENTTSKMNLAYPLSEYFADGPAPMKNKKVDVIAVTESILESLDKVPDLADIRAFKMTEERRARPVSKIRRLPSPSEGIRDEAGIKQSTDENRGVHAHRPASNYGPPTALFNHALARLKHRLQHLDEQAELEPPPNMLFTCHQVSSMCWLVPICRQN
ncbi:uncharacterized protein FOMMEDRAFT_159219 [Fomitiporia mediterranea MF3/22]|uniref:uncharacterized protein n=1 Tax=Fomitiporia mediterranea (strain MF3/22) TaxID=694068 RepID=UPI0004407E29|nr:uncharacterized protein FOMMEDRAFT_159219 [Fomitiporia mediterranea MF3/22]EJD00500.1 hypothetical protein FOMMEDRAFT_159219 [Fomitiporia mediterranea MF3/22]